MSLPASTLKRSATAIPISTASLLLPDIDIRTTCRKVAPFMVHKWKDVCDELGVLTRDIRNVQEKYTPASGMSELAYQGLCRWLEMAGRNASKEKLTRALQVCGCRRAEEELRRITQKIAVRTPCISRPSTAPQGGKKISKQQAFIDRLARPRPLSSKPTAPVLESTKQAHKARKHKQPKACEICEMRVSITVLNVNYSKEHEDLAKEDYKHTCHVFCRQVMANQRERLRKMRDHVNFHGVSVQRITRIGFTIHVFVLFSSLGAFELFYQMYRDSRLKAIFQYALIEDTHLGEIDASSVDLSVQIDEGLINKFREILVKRGFEEPIGNHPVEQLPPLWPETDVHKFKTQDKTFSVKVWRRDLDWEIDGLETRHRRFQAFYSELLMTLRIMKPVDKKDITSLRDIIQYYRYVKNNPGATVSKNVRVDLVREYIAIVNRIRLTVENIRENEINISLDQSIKPDTCEVFHMILHRLEEMLTMNYKFRNERDSLRQPLAIFEDTFAGLLCYIPSLLNKLTIMNEKLAAV